MRPANFKHPITASVSGLSSWPRQALMLKQQISFNLRNRLRSWDRRLDAQIRVAVLRLVADPQEPRHQHQSRTENCESGRDYVSIIVHLDTATEETYAPSCCSSRIAPSIALTILASRIQSKIKSAIGIGCTVDRPSLQLFRKTIVQDDFALAFSDKKFLRTP
jgi:hypothetical protein